VPALWRWYSFNILRPWEQSPEVASSHVQGAIQPKDQAMEMKRLARLTNGHSKKIDNHVHMVALYTTWYNFARINSAVGMSPP